MNKHEGVANLIMRFLAMAIPFAIAIYWPAFVVLPDAVGPVMRPAMLGAAVVMGLCMFGEPLTAIELQMMKVFGIMWLIFVLTSAVAEEPMDAFVGLLKLILIQIFSLLMARALRYEPAAEVLGKWMYVGSIVITLFVFYAYLHILGPVLPTYAAVRGLKGIAEKQGYALNETPATAILAFICSTCLRPMTKFKWAVGAAIVIIGALLTGSRAALAIPVLAALILLIVLWMRSNSTWRKFFAVAMIVLGLSAIVCAVVFIPSSVISKASEGRWDLWTAGISKFLERPLLGWGFQSWKSDLASRLPGEYQLSNYLAQHIVGGYHNEYVAALSEHGLAGFVALMMLYMFGIGSAWKLAFRRTLTWKFGYAALFGVLFLMVRANVELDGLFGFSQDPVDYSAYVLLAIIVSRLSIEEIACQRAIQNAQSVRFQSRAVAFPRRPRRAPATSDRSSFGEIR